MCTTVERRKTEHHVEVKRFKLFNTYSIQLLIIKQTYNAENHILTPKISFS